MYAYLTFAGGKPSLMPEGGGRVAEFENASSFFQHLIEKVSRPIIFADGLTGAAKNPQKLASILDKFSEIKEKRELTAGERHTVRALDGTIYRAEICAEYAPGRAKRIVFVNFDEMALHVDALLEKFGLDDQPRVRLAAMQRYRMLLRREGLTSFTARKNAEKELLPLYDEWFPKLPEHIDELCAAAYRGGIQRTSQTKLTLRDVDAYDFRGLYSAIYADRLPAGSGVYAVGDDIGADIDDLRDITLRPDTFCVVRFFANVHRCGGADSFLQDLRACRADGSRELLTLTNIDFNLAEALGYLFESLKPVECVAFPLIPSPLRAYAERWERVKKDADTWARRSIAKKQLNVPAGAFGSKTALRYIPAACFITAAGRYQWLTASLAAKEAGAKVVYGNTDSLHIDGSDGERETAANILRQWGLLGDGEGGKLALETSFKEVTYRGINLYAGRTSDGGEVVKAAGLPLKSKKQLNYDKFKNGCEIIAEYGDGSKITWSFDK